MARLLRDYGIGGALQLSADFLRTRLFFPSARLVRFPIQVRGRKWIDLGSGLTTGRRCRIDAFALSGRPEPVIRFGAGVQINDDVHIGAIESVEIRDRVLIASRVFISDHNHGRYSGEDPQSDPGQPPAERLLQGARVVIEEDVWIGESAVVLPGVSIGRGAIVGALSLVNRDVPAYSIVGGIPARVLKTYDFRTRRWERV